MNFEGKNLCDPAYQAHLETLNFRLGLALRTTNGDFVLTELRRCKADPLILWGAPYAADDINPRSSEYAADFTTSLFHELNRLHPELRNPGFISGPLEYAGAFMRGSLAHGKLSKDVFRLYVAPLLSEQTCIDAVGPMTIAPDQLATRARGDIASLLLSYVPPKKAPIHGATAV